MAKRLGELFDWTDDRLRTLDAMWPTHTVTKIAAALGTTPGSVVGKAHRRGLSKPSPIRKRDPDAPTPVKRPVGAGQQAIREQTLPPLASRPFNPLALTPSAAAIAPPPIIAQPVQPRLMRSTCAWPIGEPRDRGFRYCEAPCIAPYCDEHRAMAYAPRGSVKAAKLSVE